MEFFMAKVRYGGGERFDPMMDERGGWIASEKPRQDAKMEEAMIKNMAQGQLTIIKRRTQPT